MQIVVNLVQETYEVQWPLSLVISRKALTKYQLIFRFLFHYKHVDLQLCGAWQIHQGVCAVNTKGTAISRSSLLCRSLLKFINSLLHYLKFEVLEPNWHVMHNRLQTAKSIDDVIEFCNFFLEKCIRECLLLLPEVLKNVHHCRAFLVVNGIVSIARTCSKGRSLWSIMLMLAGRVSGVDLIERITKRCIRIVKNPEDAEVIACVLCSLENLDMVHTQ
ncbi:gamma-tubulin complex component 2-like isoform X2 [Camellia sinensis]|uniref:gamma-tubulin complex component 2-like isoform X2 n=1 Tax=Camellia sinensis TaxID=4442 RepID=UPI0010357814|nr:gamma-tubulin complex component 2-like isoform X2 [Camellia sinensis]